MNLQTFQQVLLQTVAYRNIHSIITEVLEPYGLNVSQWIIISLLHERGNLRISDIAGFLQVKDPLATKLVSDLVDDKFLRLRPSKKDKRVKVASLTTKANGLVEELEAKMVADLAPIVACVSPADWETYYATLGKIIIATSP